MDMYVQNQPMIYHPQYLVGGPIVRPVDQIREWNFLFKQYKEFAENMNSVYQQADILQRRQVISTYMPQDLTFWGYKQLNLFPSPIYEDSALRSE